MDQNRYIVRKGIVERNIHGAYFLIDIFEKYKDDKCSLYEINEFGHIIWNGLTKYNDNQAENITKEIMSIIVDDNVNSETVYEDVLEYLDILKENGFLVKNGRIKQQVT